MKEDQWIRARRMEVRLLIAEAIYVFGMLLSLIFCFPLFVIEFKLAVVFTIFVMVKELFEIKFKFKRSTAN